MAKKLLELSKEEDASQEVSLTPEVDVTDPEVVSEVVEARSEFEDGFQVAMEALDSIDRAYGIYGKLITKIQLDANKVKSGTFSKEDLEESVVEFTEDAEEVGYEPEQDLETVATESTDPTVGLEALDGERKSLSDRILKGITNNWENLTNTFNDIDAYVKLIQNYDVETHKKNLTLLQNGGMVKRSSVVETSVSDINKKLAIYYAMGNSKFDTNSFIKHVNLPYELIVNKKLYTDGFKSVYDSLIVSVNNEKPIPEHKQSIAVLDSFTIPEVREWLNKDTKSGLVSNFIGDKFSIISIFQDKKGADTRLDMYTVPKSYYADKQIGVVSEKDMEAILKTAIELKPKGTKLAEVGKKQYWDTMFKSTRSSIATSLFSYVYGIFAIKRQARQYMVANQYTTGVIRALLHLKKSHINTGMVITKLVSSMYETKTK